MDKLPFDPYDFFGYISSGLLVVFAMNTLLGFPNVHRTFTAFESGGLILFVYVAGQVVAGPAKTVVEDFLVCTVLNRPLYNLLRSDKSIYRFFFPGYFKRLPEVTRKALITALGAPTTSTADGIFLQLRYAPWALKNEKLLGRLDSFRDKYGFNRNLSFTSFVVGISFLAKCHTACDPAILQWGWTALVGSVFLFYRYLKFFRQYSYELLNAYAGTLQQTL